MAENVLFFNKKIYAQNAISESARSFRDLADFKISAKNSYFVVTINNIDKNFKHIMKYEFANFVLAKTKELCSR